ncbi:MAG: DUF1353 domain-containing protein [Flavobacteriales bacterium]|jgi:hypothetical protein|nr:DUF1353 domain-containing protein [Flavobacteriales bacterium]
MQKGGFKTLLIVRFRVQPQDGKWFVLSAPLVYVSESGTEYVVPVGVNTDFASIPRGLRWLIPRVGKHGKAAVLHDYLCEYGIVPRKKADRIFLEAMKALEVGWLKRRTMYSAVAAYTTLMRKK